MQKYISENFEKISNNFIELKDKISEIEKVVNECIKAIKNGNKIMLGKFGTFGINLSSMGAESVEKFTSKNIKAVKIQFTPGADFENLIDRAEFNLVASRVAQASKLKAMKAGETTV